MPLNAKENVLPSEVEGLVVSLNSFIMFQIGVLEFGVPLQNVREIAEYSEAIPLPNAPAYFKGLVNIRGEIIGVIDLGDMLGIERTVPRFRSLLIFENEASGLAVVVDRVKSVSEITKTKIQNNQSKFMTIHQDVLLGATKIKDAIIPLIDIYRLLTKVVSIDVEQIKTANIAAAKTV